MVLEVAKTKQCEHPRVRPDDRALEGRLVAERVTRCLGGLARMAD